VSALYDLRIAIEKKIKGDGLDEAKFKGQIGLRAGKLLALITPNTPDDPAVIAKLRQAAKDVLHASF